MLVLYILIGIVLLVTAALFLPISVDLKYNKEFTFKVKVTGFKVYPKPEKPQQNEPLEKTPTKQKGIFEILKEKHGFVGAVREIFSFAKDCIEPLKHFLKFVHFKKVRLLIKVVGEDAAKTAVDYGLTCSAVYPLLSFVEGFANVKYKKMDCTGSCGICIVCTFPDLFGCNLSE